MITKRYGQIVNSMHIENELVSEFFIFFSRFEYSLKEAGFYDKERNSRNNNNRKRDVKPDWNAFARRINNSFRLNENAELKEAVTYLKTKMPKKQIVTPLGLKWDTVEKGNGEPKMVWLLRLAKAVRNNLFHGGKYPGDPIRDEKLLISCLIVLDECLNLEPARQVKEYFEKLN